MIDIKTSDGKLLPNFAILALEVENNITFIRFIVIVKNNAAYRIFYDKLLWEKDHDLILTSDRNEVIKFDSEGAQIPGFISKILKFDAFVEISNLLDLEKVVIINKKVEFEN